MLPRSHHVSKDIKENVAQQTLTGAVFQWPERPRERLTGLQNQGGTCYLNTLLQTLLHTPEFTNRLFSLKKRQKRDNVKRMIQEMLNLFQALISTGGGAISSKALTDSFGWTEDEVCIHQDIQELNRLLFEQIEIALKGTSECSLINDIFRGVQCTRIRCLRCGRTSERNDEFQDINLSVMEYNSVEQSLEAHTQMERLTGENQYFCDSCQCKVDAVKMTRFSELPPVLTLSLSRFYFDAKSMQSMKLEKLCSFPLVLDMNRFLVQPKSTSMRYDLFSVVLHVGGSTCGGHYHAFIKDPYGTVREPRVESESNNKCRASTTRKVFARSPFKLSQKKAPNEHIEHRSMNTQLNSELRSQNTDSETSSYKFLKRNEKDAAVGDHKLTNKLFSCDRQTSVTETDCDTLRMPDSCMEPKVNGITENGNGTKPSERNPCSPSIEDTETATGNHIVMEGSNTMGTPRVSENIKVSVKTSSNLSDNSPKTVSPNLADKLKEVVLVDCIQTGSEQPKPCHTTTKLKKANLNYHSKQQQQHIESTKRYDGCQYRHPPTEQGVAGAVGVYAASRPATRLRSQSAHVPLPIQRNLNEKTILLGGREMSSRVKTASSAGRKQPTFKQASIAKQIPRTNINRMKTKQNSCLRLNHTQVSQKNISNRRSSSSSPNSSSNISTMPSRPQHLQPHISSSLYTSSEQSTVATSWRSKLFQGESKVSVTSDAHFPPTSEQESTLSNGTKFTDDPPPPYEAVFTSRPLMMRSHARVLSTSAASDTLYEQSNYLDTSQDLYTTENAQTTNSGTQNNMTDQNKCDKSNDDDGTTEIVIGRWFDFNDENISEVDPSCFSRVFQGPECAYMLFYRLVNMVSTNKSTVITSK